jgi:hypothetical protein
VLTRRRFLMTAAAAGLALGGSGLAFDRVLGRNPLEPAPAGLPRRQHAWNAALRRDDHGNPVAPRFQRLLCFDIERRPSGTDVRSLESALRAIERRYPWGPTGVLFTVSWGPRYFDQTLGIRSPVERPKALSDFELPILDDYGACIHLASDSEQRLATVEHTLARSADVLELKETRGGFVGAGLPAANQAVSGVPAGRPVPATAPLYMGFKSGYRRNQASEDAVTIPTGPFVGGTTMHVSRLRLRLDSWYRLLDERDRVARMFAPQVAPAQVARFTTDAPSHPSLFDRAASVDGVVGHAQAAARVRRGGRPLILRRDFDSTDGGEAGLHFVSLQRTIEDFVKTRTAMNAAGAFLLNPGITDTVNNGINEFIFVTHRANYLVPPRSQRSFPLLPGREVALD